MRKYTAMWLMYTIYLLFPLKYDYQNQSIRLNAGINMMVTRSFISIIKSYQIVPFYPTSFTALILSFILLWFACFILVFYNTSEPILSIRFGAESCNGCLAKNRTNKWI